MTRLSVAVFGLMLLSTFGRGQDPKTANSPFALTRSEGRCLGCKIATGLGRVQFISRKDVWAVGSNGAMGAGTFIVVHSTDAGRTWREVSQTHQYAGDLDGPPAFSFLDAMRGWIAWWDPADEPQMISTRDGGQHWRSVSRQDLRIIQMVNDSRGYGTSAEAFFRTNDGGHSWVETKIPNVVSIQHLFFLTPELGWIAGTAGMHGKDFFVFRTVNGGRDWEGGRCQSALRHFSTDLPAKSWCESKHGRGANHLHLRRRLQRLGANDHSFQQQRLHLALCL